MRPHVTNENCEQRSISKHHNTHPEGTLHDMTESYHLKAMVLWTGDSAWCYCFGGGVGKRVLGARIRGMHHHNCVTGALTEAFMHTRKTGGWRGGSAVKRALAALPQDLKLVP